MLTLLISALIGLDVVLLLAVISLSRRRASVDISRELQDLTEERRYMMELRQSIQEDLESAQARSKLVLNQVTKIAAEAEQEVKIGSDAVAKELEGLVQSLTARFDEPLNQMIAKLHAGEKMLSRLDSERQHLNKSIQRAESLTRFFNEKVPYQHILEELQDKKYQDARQMLARGMKSEQIAKELGLSKAEMEVIAGTF